MTAAGGAVIRYLLNQPYGGGYTKYVLKIQFTYRLVVQITCELQIASEFNVVLRKTCQAKS